MRDLGELFRQYWKVSTVFGLLALVYVLQGLFTPVDPDSLAKYHLTSIQARELGLTISLPYVIIWAIALTGYLRLRMYTEVLGASKDGRAFKLIRSGVFWFTLWLPLSALLGVAGELAFRNHPELTPAVIRFEIYANLLLLFPGFYLVYKGSKRLVTLTKNRLANPSQWVTLVFIAFAVLYTFMVLQDSARRVAPDTVTTASYYMSDWLITCTVVIPRLLCWFLGVQAVYNILLYRRKIAGVIYRDALKYLSFGLGGITLIVILLRCMQSLNNPLSELSLVALILVVYLLLIVISIGYLMVSKGAKHLLAIEES